MKVEIVKKIIVYLYGVISDLQAKLAEALSKPPVGQEELDAANQVAAEYKAKYEEVQAKYEGVVAEDTAEEEILGGIIEDFKTANPDAVVE
jgi:hypothetical protein